MQQHTLGSISHAIMKPEDLIPVFMNELETLDKERYDIIKKDYQEDLKAIEYYNTTPYSRHISEQQEQINWLLEELFDTLNNYCMPYFYFGAHEGDGSDYGFWLSYDSFEGDNITLKVSDLSELDKYSLKDLADYTYIAVVNDHGNITLYTPKIEFDEVWSII